LEIQDGNFALLKQIIAQTGSFLSLNQDVIVVNNKYSGTKIITMENKIRGGED
jgi:hypothetical protein